MIPCDIVAGGEAMAAMVAASDPSQTSPPTQPMLATYPQTLSRVMSTLSSKSCK